jgi:type II secretory pathway predicted ATPase ExeA
MFEFLNTVAKENAEIASFLFISGGLLYLIYYIIQTTKADNTKLQDTISRQHKEALDVTHKVVDAHIENTKVLTELKIIIQTLNK